MRLLVVSQYFWPEDFRINELVSELSRRGHHITVLTGKPNYPDGKIFVEFVTRPEAFSMYYGARVIRVPMLPRGRGAMRLLLNYLSYAVSATIFGMIRLKDERFDAVFVFEPSPVTVGIPAIALRQLRSWPVAFWVLDQWPETLAAVGVVRSATGLSLVGQLVSFIYSRCDLILIQSRSLVVQVRKYCDDRKPIIYFPNWAESNYVAEGSAPAPEVAESFDGFTVMFAGNIGESQNFPAILDAAEALKTDSSIRWLIVGDGRAADWVNREVRRRGIEKTFVLLGRYPIDRMPSFYRHANALLVSLKPDPIFSMTIPGKIQSYLAFGLPVLAMLDGEGAKVIDEANAGLTCPAGDSRGLADNVLRMAALTNEERSAMGSQGAAYAKREFDRDMLVTRLEGLLAALSRSDGTAAG